MLFLLALLVLATFLLATGCAPEITVKKTQDYCAEYNFESPGESTIESAWEGGEAKVWRTYAIEPAGVTFEAEVVAEGDVLHLYEAWSDSTSEDELCYQPTLTVGGIERSLEVRWYLEGENVPMATVILEAP